MYVARILEPLRVSEYKSRVLIRVTHRLPKFRFRFELLLVGLANFFADILTDSWAFI